VVAQKQEAAEARREAQLQRRRETGERLASPARALTERVPHGIPRATEEVEQDTLCGDQMPPAPSSNARSSTPRVPPGRRRPSSALQGREHDEASQPASSASARAAIPGTAATGARKVGRTQAPGRQPSPSHRPASSGLPTLKRQSNAKIIRNALVYVCLAGFAKQKEQKECISVIEANVNCNYVILFASERNLTFKGLYQLANDEETDELVVQKAYGQGPALLGSDNIFKFYKYDSASKSFKFMSTKTLGLTVDGIALPWPSKTLRPKERP